MNLRNILQIIGKPNWAINTLRVGKPEFANLKPYMPKNLNLKQLGQFMDQTFSGRLNEEKIKPIRDMWPHKLVLKGVASEADAEKAIQLGLDGIIVSNHGGRQLDAGTSSIKALQVNRGKIPGQNQNHDGQWHEIRAGHCPHVGHGSRIHVSWAERFMYGVAALGETGGNHTISILKRQLQQVMEQICCEQVQRFSTPFVALNAAGEDRQVD